MTQDKSKYFATALIATLFCITVTSIFLDNDLFSDIVKGTTIPLLFFTALNVVAFIYDGVVQLCKHRIKEQNKERPYVEDILQKADKVLNDFIKIHDEIQKEAEEKPAKKEEKWWQDRKRNYEDYIKEWREDKEYWQSVIDTISSNCKIYENIIDKIKSKKWLGRLYTALLAFLFLGMILSPLIAPCLNCVTLPVFALSALTITITQALWGNCLITRKFHKMFDDEAKKYFDSKKKLEDTTNG